MSKTSTLHLPAGYEVSLTFIKSPSKDFARVVYGELDDILDRNVRPFRFTTPQLVYPGEDVMRAHYQHVRHLPFYEQMIVQLCRGIVVRAYTGSQGLIKAVLDATGPTNPENGQPWQIRRLFYHALLQNPVPNNVIHRSGTSEEGFKEAERFNSVIDWSTLCTR